MNIYLTDSTLREGLQSPGDSIFRNNEAMVSYALLDAQYGITDKCEVYMPGPYIDLESWQRVVHNLGEKSQIYVGPAHWFNLDKRRELIGRSWPLLSTTLIYRDSDSISKLGSLSTQTEHSPLRVGLECVSSYSPEATIETIRQVNEQAGVSIITLSDSNGRMDHVWINDFFDIFNRHGDLPRHLGFHIHNGVRAAVDKAAHIVLRASQNGLEELNFDTTFLGLGEQLGILALHHGVILQGNSEPRMRALKAFGRRVLEYINVPQPQINTPHKATSHYDNNGNLRQEYR